MKRAYCLISRKIYVRQQAVIAGLQACGYIVSTEHKRAHVARGDVLVIWNRRNYDEAVADAFEAAGGVVIVMENGYLGTHPTDGRYYAAAIHGHNGSGQCPHGDASRFDTLGVSIKPWRSDGDHVLVCPNRFIAPHWFRMPSDWTDRVVANLRKVTGRPIRIRPHPGNWKRNPPKKALVDDLRDAWACVIWSSSAGVHALVAGVPVICTAPWWICKTAAGDDLARIERPSMPDRLPAFQRLAWGQWSLSEIETGEAFSCLLSMPAQDRIAA